MLITAARDVVRVAPRRELVPSPQSFAGTLAELWEQFIERNIPAADAVARFHQRLSRYLGEPHALHLVRQVRGMTRREEYTTADGTRLKATDNAPAWWLHYALLQDCEIAPDAFGRVVESMPAHLFDISRTMPTSANAAGWHVAHIFAVKDGNTDYRTWRRADAVRRFVRNVHPCNYSLIPKPDWQCWGGDARVIGFFVERFAERYAEVWDEFLALAHADPAAVPRGGESIAYKYPAAVKSPVTGDGMPKLQASIAAEVMVPTPVSYQATRLLFKRDVIEGLASNERFRIVTPHGTFEMSKDDFGHAFANVRRSASYRERGTYHYAVVPGKALQFLIDPPASASGVP